MIEAFEQIHGKGIKIRHASSCWTHLQRHIEGNDDDHEHDKQEDEEHCIVPVRCPALAWRFACANHLHELNRNNNKTTYQLVVDEEDKSVRQRADDRQDGAEDHAHPHDALPVHDRQHALRNV